MINFKRTKALNNIPHLRLKHELASIHSLDLPADKKNFLNVAFNRYYESNIPIEYWSLSMTNHFVGHQTLLDAYTDYTKDLNKSYTSGRSICFAGLHGLGKSFIMCSILKDAAKKGYSCLHTNLSDIVHVLTTNHDERFEARKELLMVDFLAIDEFDPRFMPTENAADLYARTLETVFRSRSQNKLPTLMATNSPNVLESFSGTLKDSIDSLFNGYIKIIPVFGNDFRKTGGK